MLALRVMLSGLFGVLRESGLIGVIPSYIYINSRSGKKLSEVLKRYMIRRIGLV